MSIVGELTEILVAASSDQMVILWERNPESLKTEDCRIANRKLTVEEWCYDIGTDVPYRKTCESLPGPPLSYHRRGRLRYAASPLLCELPV